MKFVIISDTHGFHRDLELPQGDVLIHAGDISDYGRKEEIIDFLEWFSTLPHPHKIFIGGNHDIFLDENPVDLLEYLPSNVVYLNNRGYKIDNIKLWGSPVAPDLEGWAFGKPRESMEEHWKYMPKDIDILITHTPPVGILDQSSQRKSLGCEALLKKVLELKPRYHLFGHIHASYGTMDWEGTTYINASIMDSYRGPINAPFTFDYQKPH